MTLTQDEKNAESKRLSKELKATREKMEREEYLCEMDARYASEVIGYTDRGFCKKAQATKRKFEKLQAALKALG